MKRPKFTIRIMWEDPLDKDNAIKFMKELEDLLTKKGYKHSKPKFFRNRKNGGGRIYITVY